MYNPTVNAILALNPNALSIADEMDVSLAASNATSSLFCIPVLLKDNYDTVEMPTTGGSLALSESQPTVDASVVTALKNAGAIMLGKTNLHEMALEGLSVSSLGGQTINPYDHTRTPGGSSGGTGAAIAASMAVFGTGTDTVNSLRNPASANSLFSIRPTRGLISRAGVIPVSHTQDAVGPMTRTVKDLATALTVMASTGTDPNDNSTTSMPAKSVQKDYCAVLPGRSLRRMRFGLIEGFFNRTASDETTPVINAMTSMLSTLTTHGATIVPINSPIYNTTTLLTLDLQTHEYRQCLEKYLQNPSLKGTHPTTLHQLYTSNQHLLIPAQYPYLTSALSLSPSSPTYPPKISAINSLTTSLQKTFRKHSLTALLYPQQKNLVVKLASPSQSGRNGILAALTGFPVVTVPAGFSPSTADAPVGVSIGMEVLGMPWSEGVLLGIAKRIEEARRVRRMPVFAEGEVEARAMERVPVLKPDRGNIPSVYPVGVR
ncbi:hypothetical protein MMC12_005281 [Toensbergia leucococca]|nr:hypothetical protein [Toensbergia leucococca]